MPINGKGDPQISIAEGLIEATSEGEVVSVVRCGVKGMGWGKEQGDRNLASSYEDSSSSSLGTLKEESAQCSRPWVRRNSGSMFLSTSVSLSHSPAAAASVSKPTEGSEVYSWTPSDISVGSKRVSKG